MKIIFDGLIYYLQKQGGISRYFDELIENFSIREDCEVTVLLRKNKIGKVFNKRVKIEIIDSTIDSDNKIKKYISVFKDKRAVNNYLKKNSFSDSVFHYSYYSFYKNLEAKSVLTVHDLVHEKFPNFFGGLLNRIYLSNKKKSIAKADVLIAISEQTKKDLIDIYKVDGRKINVIYHGLSNNFRVLIEHEKEVFLADKKIKKPYFIFVGNRDLYKNFIFLLEAFAVWPKNNIYDLYCVGGGEFTATEKFLIDKLKLNDKIKFFLNVSEENLIGFYNCSLALIYPSLYEGFGFPLLESMACGTDVLASDIEIFHEIGGDIPIYFNPGNFKSLVEVLDKSLLYNRVKSASGLELVKKYNWENTISKTLEAYMK